MAVKRTRVVNKDNNKRTVTVTRRSGATVEKSRSKYKGDQGKVVVKQKKKTSPDAETSSTTRKVRSVTNGGYGKNKQKTVTQTREKRTATGGVLKSTGTVTKTRSNNPNTVSRSTRVTGSMKSNGRKVSDTGKVGRKEIIGASTTSTSRRRIVPRKKK